MLKISIFNRQHFASPALGGTIDISFRFFRCSHFSFMHIFFFCIISLYFISVELFRYFHCCYYDLYSGVVSLMVLNFFFFTIIILIIAVSYDYFAVCIIFSLFTFQNTSDDRQCDHYGCILLICTPHTLNKMKKKEYSHLNMKKFQG